MNYYAVQVKTRAEKKFIQLFRTNHPEAALPIHFLQRHLEIRKNGKVKSTYTPIFPGYIFVEAAGDEEIKTKLWHFRRTDGFCRFLKTNNDITALSSRDLEVVLHFINNANPYIGKSKVYFNEDSRIVVLEGPLAGLEGMILKVDRRKGRAKVKLDLYEDSFTIDLAFEVIEPTMAKPTAAEHQKTAKTKGQ